MSIPHITDKIYPYLSSDIYTSTENQVLDLKPFRKTPSPGADATKPKYEVVTPSGVIWFKFGLTVNELCAELFSYKIATALNISVAKTSLAVYKNSLGIASWDVGVYQEPSDMESYAIGDFLHLRGFLEMCLFDYLVMNEDRHAGNWGFNDGHVKSLFDHNVCFGGEVSPKDADIFMKTLTSAFVAKNEYENNQDLIFNYIAKRKCWQTCVFLRKIAKLPPITIDVLLNLYPREHNMVSLLLEKRKLYMLKKGSECLECNFVYNGL